MEGMSAEANGILEERAIRMIPIIAARDRHEELTELAHLISGKTDALQLSIENADGSHDLPPEVGVLLERLLVLLGRGDGVSVVGVPEELTTQQAADLLNVSRQHLVRLLDAGEMPFRRTASHRRVAAADVLAYKAIRDAKRHKELQKLTRLTEERDGYERELAP